MKNQGTDYKWDVMPEFHKLHEYNKDIANEFIIRQRKTAFHDFVSDFK